MSTDREFGRFCSSRSCFHCRLLIKMYTHHLGTLQIHHQTQRLLCRTRRRRGPTHEIDTSAHKHASRLTKHEASARPLMAKGCSDIIRGALGPMAWQVAAPGGQHERDGTRVGAPGRRPRMGPQRPGSANRGKRSDVAARMRAEAGQQGEGKGGTHRAPELEQEEPAPVDRSCCSCRLSFCVCGRPARRDMSSRRRAPGGGSSTSRGARRRKPMIGCANGHTGDEE